MCVKDGVKGVWLGRWCNDGSVCGVVMVPCRYRWVSDGGRGWGVGSGRGKRSSAGDSVGHGC